jgi:hypothetical protein
VAEDAKVDTPIAAYREMVERWALPDALLGGTLTMRAESSTYLPQEPGETVQAYAIRVGRSMLFNAYRDSIVGLGERPFAEAVSLGEGASEQLTDFVEDVDGEGRTMNDFSRELLRDGINRGVSGILVDFPPAPPDLTLEQEQRLGLRPFWSHVPSTRVIGWRSERYRGEETLTQLRITENVVVPVDEYGEKTVARVREYRRRLPTEENEADDEGETFWVLWEKGDDDEWHPVDGGPVTLNVIPFVPFYTNRTGFLTGLPPLEDLAWKNLEHFQSSSDQRHILRFARAPLLFGSGFADDELQGRVEIGASRMLKAKNPSAKLSYVEHEGRAIESGEKDIRRLKEEMVVLGMKPLLLNRPGTVTATASAIEEVEETSQLKTWVRGLESSLSTALDLALAWMGEEPPSDGTPVNVCDRFTVVADSAEIDRLLALRGQGDLSRRTLYDELKKRGLLGEYFDADEEERRLAGEDLGSAPDDDDEGVNEE